MYELLMKHIGYVADTLDTGEARKDRGNLLRILVCRCTRLKQAHWIGLVYRELDRSHETLIARVRNTA